MGIPMIKFDIAINRKMETTSLSDNGLEIKVL